MPWRRPYYYRRPYYPRRRYFRKWRPRRFVRRRWRRRVRRKLKLKTIRLKQYQPHTIHKCKITGMLCLLQTNMFRIGNNYTSYENSIVPPHLPSGGSFSIMRFTLNTLYSMHQQVRNYWTRSNKELPLVKYQGCRIKLYQSRHLDYYFRYHNSYPMTSTQEMYASMQPNVISMLTHTIRIPSRQTYKKKKPYKTIFIRPPSQWENKWYFQHNICNTGLFLAQTVAASFEQYYTATYSRSNNISIHSLNTLLFQNTQFHTNPDDGYYTRYEGTKKRRLYGTRSQSPIAQIKIGEIIYLGDTRNNTEGYSYTESHDNNWNNWKNGPPKKWWGNPFHKYYQQGDYRLLYSDEPIQTIFNKTDANQPATNLTELSSTITWDLRYNPRLDNGKGNKVYLVRNFQDNNNYDPLNKPEILFEGYPLWILLNGYLDFQKHLAAVQQIETHYMLVIQTEFTTPKAKYIVPLDYHWTQGKSPYEDDANPIDYNKWYPMTQYQEPNICDIIRTGPGTPKLPKDFTAEANCKYCFYFKFGGNPPPMETVINPFDQPTYAVPSNISQTTSLQNPATPIQYFLSNFDQRRHELTNTATKRITKDWDTKASLFTDQGPISLNPPTSIQPQETTDQETSESEKEEETLYQQLQQQRKEQRRLKQRIRQLLTKLQTFE
nr:MAG: ORF1 [TTV-like mini virus]